VTNKTSYDRIFSDNSFGEMVDSLNTVLLDIRTSNFGGQVIDIELPINGGEVRIAHSLKMTPKYRIILRSQKSIIIDDGDSVWTDKYIYLRAKSATDTGTTAISFILLKG